jgi:hypothetical protein
MREARGCGHSSRSRSRTPSHQSLPSSSGYRDFFYIRNALLNRYVAVPSSGRQIVASNKPDPFFIAEQDGLFVFTPVNHPDKVIVNENGNVGNNTTLILGQRQDPNPAWARWELTKATS